VFLKSIDCSTSFNEITKHSQKYLKGILHASVNYAFFKNSLEINTTSFIEKLKAGFLMSSCAFEFLALMNFFQLELFSEEVFTQNLQ